MFSPKKIALWFLIAAVLLSALLGIVAILSGNFGELELKIVLTTATISVASICALTNAALLESKRARALPLAGLILSILSAALLIGIIWIEPSGEQVWRFTASVCVLAIATSHASLLSLAKLSRRFIWARVAAFLFVYSLALLIIFMIETDRWGTKMFQAIGVDSILVAAVSILIPVFHRLSAADTVPKSEGQHQEHEQQTWANMICPRCEAKQFNALGEITCSTCGCKFLVSILEP